MLGDFSPIIYMMWSYIWDISYIELRDAKSLNLPLFGSEPNINLPDLLCYI